MQIRILGNGGAVNDGLPYNSFIADNYFLVETPPDIMNSLFREKTDLSAIRVIYISHFHGDHYFGLPFLILRLFFNSAGQSMNFKIRILGPPGIKNRSKEICRLALSENHPVNSWIDDNFIFDELEADGRIHIENDSYLKVFSMNHFTETYGFSFFKNYRIIFSYFADTIWSDELISQIKLFPQIIITDLNGEPSDPQKIHLSEEDLIEKGIPHSKGKIMFYGTHIKKQKGPSHKQIEYVYPGLVISLPE
ncbi:MAG: hypothetical protein CVV49_11070 [Spirochaetae bacterium HGW-Spirochaetae-5]|nr:MAG: hypothetical protein CVV49_11070 [Spirochaetae bacterium HGW-Spirochaetae-5]